ncbi:S-adenosyl-L-methionine-dependent methyltransferase [Cucurbitaria berberidis CBS 394.84]|uniref:tRNA (uracil(54)-C(5))-methyltransferase n=1 Tax=Cucurbitaria berberidis CBS 394.84 TaxID=1168544 RepID=A0A9P4G7Z1_9PLEO|nr:S-adenosyl-L-methionine-dependent methyltransferase [Cucurbitaria berberidis CBS 394.84]KAF1840723.1 S-adenosyl-L-methionine-dependent methyltransferase [Cucurbitaria berberidis CBS 394.84]
MASAANNVAPIESNGAKRYAETPLRTEEGSRGNYRFKNKRMKNGHAETSKILKTNGTNEEILLEDVTALLKKVSLEREGKENSSTLPERLSEIEVTIQQISSTGDGLGLQNGSDSDQVYVVPFTAPGDTVTAKIFKHFEREKYSMADIVKVITPSPHRDSSLVKCRYFASCSGCQFQMLPYDYQLQHKKSIVEKAYKNFSNLPPELIPAIGDTIGSPLQYGYRTKLTPHFDGPPDARRSDGRNGIKRSFKELPPIGFMKKGTRITIDIEDCPIGTDAVRNGNKRERKRVADNLDKYHKGATLLLRESTERTLKEEYDASAEKDPDAVVEDTGVHLHRKICVTDPNAKTTEYIGDFQFVNPAGSFFQNNNSILPDFTQYIREHILPSTPDHKITHLIDAYSGSGLFTITLSALFKSSLGIDISSSSIQSATTNAALNNLPESSTRFIAADAARLFASISSPADETVVMIDPPRKGCDESFLRQLVQYGPARVVYVSCNVHTQARDIGVLVGGMTGVDGGFGTGEGCYEIESLRGFDFFPQTGHVEGVAVLKRKSAGAKTEEQQGATKNDHV